MLLTRNHNCARALKTSSRRVLYVTQSSTLIHPKQARSESVKLRGRSVSCPEVPRCSRQRMTLSYYPHLDETDGMPELLLETIFADVCNFVIYRSTRCSLHFRLSFLVDVVICASYDIWFDKHMFKLPRARFILHVLRARHNYRSTYNFKTAATTSHSEQMFYFQADRFAVVVIMCS